MPCAAQDARSKAAQKAQPCAVCHGQDGIGTSPIFPNLAGQKALYLVKALKEYRSGRRADPVMAVAARDLTDEDIDLLAEYYEALGVYVAAADVNGDGFADIGTGPGRAADPMSVFSGTDGSILQDFFAYDVAFTGGVAVAAADVTDDGQADIITGPGPGGGPDVRIFHGGTLQPVSDFLVYDPSFQGGVFVGGR